MCPTDQRTALKLKSVWPGPDTTHRNSDVFIPCPFTRGDLCVNVLLPVSEYREVCQVMLENAFRVPRAFQREGLGFQASMTVGFSRNDLH